MKIGYAAARNFASLCLAAASLAAPFAGAWAQGFPDRPITLIVPWPPGGSTDRHLRALAEIAGRISARPSSCRTSRAPAARSGPGNMALNAKPDGYTIAQFPMGMLRLPHMQKTAWNPINDFTLHHRRLGLHLRLHGARRLAVQDASTITSRRRARSRARSTTAPPAPARRRIC